MTRSTQNMKEVENVRKSIHVLSASLAMLTLLMAVSPTLASSHGPTVRVLGRNSVRINQMVTSSYHFGPGRLRVSPGETVTFENTGACSIDCDHTVSIVNEEQLPVSVVQVFSCLFDAPGTVCAAITSAHMPQGPGGPVVLRANITGEPSGFFGANSLLLGHAQTIEVTITAPAGTTFHYMCGIHPWMQGSISVGENDSDSD